MSPHPFFRFSCFLRVSRHPPSACRRGSRRIGRAAGKALDRREDEVGDVADLLAQLFLSRQGFPFSTEDIQSIFQGQRISRFSLRLYISDPSMLLAAFLPAHDGLLPAALPILKRKVSSSENAGKDAFFVQAILPPENFFVACGSRREWIALLRGI